MTEKYMPVLRRMRAVLIFVPIILCQSCWSGFNSAMDGMWSGIASPDEVVFVDSTISSGTLTLKYTIPTDARFDHTEVSWTGPSTGSLTVPKTASQCDVTGLSDTTTASINEYTITVRSVDLLGNRSAGTSFRFMYRSSDTAVKFIYSAADFDAIPWAAIINNYVLMTDIDRSTYSNWTPVEFKGTLNGNNHVIRNLTVSETGFNAGLFLFSTAIINGLGLVNADIRLVSNELNQVYVGGLMSTNNDGVIVNCFITGKVSVSSGNNVTETVIGGLVGENTGIISKCYTAVKVSGVGTNENLISIGGITGTQSDGTLQEKITNCFAVGSVTSNVQGNINIGGLVGFVDAGSIDNSYATGTVSYTTVGATDEGGLVGSKGVCIITSSYYDSATTGQSDTGKGVGKTTAEMKTQSTFSGWDFSGVWSINASVNNGYPYLSGMLP